MIIVLSIALIFAAIMNILALRRRRERLQVFYNVEPKVVSLMSLVENQIAGREQSFSDQVLFGINASIKFNYRLLMMGKSKTSTFMYILAGTVACILLNEKYLNYDNFLVIPVGVVFSIYVICLFRKRKLKADFYSNFPEALNIITGLIASGYAITTTFKTCANSIEGIVGTTFKEVNDRLEVGDNVENVLLNSYMQLPFPEYYFFILTVMVNLDSGGELKEIFSRLGKMLTNNRIMAKTRDGKTAELRMTMYILGVMPFLFIGILRIVSEDNYNILMNTDGGHYILYYVIGSVITGFLIIKSWINKII
ncbi:type II secretion system F family protein [Gilliamella apicola]|uniref:type II secretion system F family protein n=1 Tax=Gilliamella apicola TaxID=1196095 RepID=UPI002FEE3091